MAERAPTLGRQRRKAKGEEGQFVLVLLGPEGKFEARRLRHDVPRPHRPPGELT